MSAGTLKRTAPGRALILFLCATLAVVAGLIYAEQARAADLTVTSSADSGPNTLRDALAVANGNGEADTINFDLPQGDRTITLISGQLVASTGEITLDSDDLVTISGNDQSRIFEVTSGNLIIRDLSLTDGNAGNAAGDNGSALKVNQGAAATIASSTISENSTGDSGGGIYNAGTLTLDSSTISENSAVSVGGGIYNVGTLAVDSSNISNNSALLGGGILNDAGTLTVTSSTISENSAGSNGGGIYSFGGILTVDSSTVSENSSASFGGGGIFSNTSPYSAGSTPPAERTTITNSTIASNSAAGAGSGVFNVRGYTEINYSTVAENTSQSTSVEGVESFGNASAGTRLTGTIVAGNTAASSAADVGNFDGTRAFESGNYNVIGAAGDRAGDFSGTNDTTGRTVEQAFGTANPTLEDNGGSTQTIEITPQSDAYNRVPSGTAGVPSEDQRGVERPQSGASDSGSYEYEDPAPTITLSPAILPGAAEDTAYSQTITATGGDAPYSYAITAGALPPGLTLSSSGTISGTPTQTGTFNFTVTATDDDDFTGSRSYTVTVTPTNDAPVVTTSAGTTAYTENGSPVAIDSALTVSDEDSTTLASATVSITSGFQSAQDTLAFTNDGQSQGNITASYNASTGVLTLTSAGSSATLAQWQSALRSVTYANSSDAPNTANRTISFTANDGEDNSNTATKTVSVTTANDAPIADNSSTSVAEDGANATFNLRDLVTDAETVDADITYAIITGPTSAQGTASISDDDVLTFDPADNFNGTVEIVYSATDEGDLSDEGTLTVTVTPVNDAPAAEEDDYQTSEDTPLVVEAPGVLDNDSDPDGDDIRAENFSQPENGEVTSFVTDGSFTYVPDDGFNGTDTFTYTMSDGQDFSEPATVTITVGEANDAPVISAIKDQKIKENSATGQIKFTVKDPDDPASTLKVSAKSSNTNLVKPGGITLSGTGENRSVKVTPVKDRFGKAKITLTVTDPDGLKDTETFTVTVTKVSEPPTNPNACTKTGTAGSDFLKGTPGHDVICGLGGNDRIEGLGGNDILKGGAGNDLIEGGAGDDTLIGGPGTDILDGGPGKNKLTQ